SIRIQIAVIALTVLLMLSSRVPVPKLLWLGKQLLPVTVVILLLQPFFSSGHGRVLWNLGPIKWTDEGVLAGIVYASRMNAMAFAAAATLFTTDPSDMVQSLVQSGFPYDWGLALALAIRFIPTLYGSFEAISDAQQARGWDPRSGSIMQRVRNYLPLLVAVIVSTLRTADNLELALVARGYGATHIGEQASPAVRGPRTRLHEIELNSSDWLIIAACVVALATFVFLVATGEISP
ncbi:MAG: energy-coupling factor transporter transmembrane component T, partial [Chloroflexota bacterium]